MLRFDTDYMAGCHPSLLEALTATNLEETPGYGDDPYTGKARRALLAACGCDPDDTKARCYFFIGGTQTNAVTLGAILPPCSGVLCADTAHINVHEAGAIELSGHKVIALPGKDGKITARQVIDYCRSYHADDTRAHIVAPSAVYVSYPTEVGTLYTLAELQALRGACTGWGLTLYVDGARLAYGLGSDKCDLTLPDLARTAHVFYAGGTKCGAMFGEALVATDPSVLPSNFFSIMKQHGAVLAKGRLLGVQFEKLFAEGAALYLAIGRHGCEEAARLRELFVSRGLPLYIDSPTNQQFFLLPNPLIDRLTASGVGFELWGPRRRRSTPVRFVTSWATPTDHLRLLDQILSCECSTFQKNS